MAATIIVIALVGLPLLFLLRHLRQEPSLPLPSGPKGKPIFQERYGISLRQPYSYVLDLTPPGPISSITILGQTMILLHDARMAVELLEKRFSNYSSPTSSSLCRRDDDVLALQPYNGRFRAYRKAMHQILGTTSLVAKFNPLQELEARRFVQRFLDDPADWVQHIKTSEWDREAGAIILQIAYGHTLGRAWRAQLLATMETPYRMVQERMANGTQGPSYLSALLEKKESLTEEEELIAKWSAGSLFTGGADTTVSTIMAFFLAMSLHPDVQVKAQEEIDRVLGPHVHLHAV
ncbi:cytochrome P450 [Aspergillus ibericus CBS 121593]|uniref:Cytochrome P450 n=1 Tax=Aspergillus ibericus CBS 121593 TaxID=1448316 RepID=A0A395HEA9_9EURO|nr:cytochrome P450 [Aspergillus ibericus CBS 121593]RAL04564.1 cytochrome P450 [Aspergillus ibericus CBS 121593]